MDGQKQLEERLKKINRMSKDSIEESLVTSALIVEKDAKINVPVDTGRLRQSISHETENFGSDNPVVIVGTNVEYAQSVEFGTSKQSAQPFLFPAYNGNKQKILKEFAKAFKKGVGL